MILYKKNLQKMLYLFLFLIFLIFMLNYFTDPYGYKNRNQKFVKNLSMFNKPHVTNARMKSDGYYYLIGSSRMARTNPSLVENITGRNTHNIKIDGATLKENRFLASEVKKNKKIFIYSFDAFSSNKTREEFNELQNRYEIYINELGKNVSLSKYLNGDITIRSLQHLIKFFKGEKINKQYLAENANNSYFDLKLAIETNGLSNTLNKSNFANFHPYSSDEIIKLAKLGTKDDIFIIFPKYVSYYYLFSKYQDIERHYFSSIRTLVENTDANVWSYYGVNDITMNENNFFDNGWHFKPKISNLIFNEVFGSINEINNKRIGFLITKDNLNDYLSSLRLNIDRMLIDNEINL
jgi:hypothetical protein